MLLYWYNIWMVSVQYRATGQSAKAISESVEAGIRAGVLALGEVLPSVRALATDLRVAPGTVASAYKLLRERGLVETGGRNGTKVSLRPPLTARSSTPPIEAGVADLADGQPDPELLPTLDLASPLTGGRSAEAPSDYLLPELMTLARNRFDADGVPTDAITIASGGLDAIRQVLCAQLRPGDAVAIEDPGWPNALDLIATLGLRTLPVAVDSQGPLAPALTDALRAGARAVIVTSRAQNPTGIVVSSRRAAELRDALAVYPQTVLIEDDHAAELAGVPLASLAGATDSWAFVRSTSKPYGPDLRVALIAGDEATIARVDGRMRVGSGWVSTLLQRLVVQLWTSDAAASVVAEAAVAYDDRRRSLIAHLAERGITGTGESGLNVWIPVADETATVTSLLRAGWAIAPGFRFRQVSQPAVRITVSGLTLATIPRLADDLASALAGSHGRRYTT